MRKVSSPGGINSEYVFSYYLCSDWSQRTGFLIGAERYSALVSETTSKFMNEDSSMTSRDLLANLKQRECIMDRESANRRGT